MQSPHMDLTPPCDIHRYIHILHSFSLQTLRKGDSKCLFHLFLLPLCRYIVHWSMLSYSWCISSHTYQWFHQKYVLLGINTYHQLFWIQIYSSTFALQRSKSYAEGKLHRHLKSCRTRPCISIDLPLFFQIQCKWGYIYSFIYWIVSRSNSHNARTRSYSVFQQGTYHTYPLSC